MSRKNVRKNEIFFDLTSGGAIYSRFKQSIPARLSRSNGLLILFKKLNET
jgi:hypothetical protein